jgi:putative transposase
MPTGYQIKDQSSAYFLTFQVVYWVDVFSRAIYRDILIESLKYCQQEKGLEIFAYVIMSNHVHLLARSACEDLSGTIQDFKKYTSKKIIETIESTDESRKAWMLRLFLHSAKRQNKEGRYQVWTHENHAEEVTSYSFTQMKVDYIHQNPVRAGFVNKPEEYKYSSAGFYADQESVLPVIPIARIPRFIK